jgi:hypothetical protein
MRSALGFIIVLWGLSHFFGEAMTSFESAASASFKAIETAAVVSEERLTKI